MSFAMRVVWIYFLLRKKLGLAKIGQPPRSPAKPSGVQSRGLSIQLEEVSGFKVYRVTPKTFNKRVVYFHGGGYVQPIASQHWKLITDLARDSQAEFLVPLYGLAPNHTVDEALELAEQIRSSLDFSIPTFLAGDSAGGGLAQDSAAGHLGPGVDGRLRGLPGRPDDLEHGRRGPGALDAACGDGGPALPQG